MTEWQRRSIIVILLFSQTACALVYDEIKSKPVEQCKTMISYADRQDCLQRYRSSYAEYEKQREQIRQQEQKR